MSRPSTLTVITTPRSVKRLANSYGLLSALLRLRTRAATIADADADRRPAMVLLAALFGFPSRGPALLTTLYRAGRESPAPSWSEFLARYTSEQPFPAAPDAAEQATNKSFEATEWAALMRALTFVTVRAENARLPLPASLRAWTRWISDVGRLSFPAGPVAADLEGPDGSDDSDLRRSPIL